MTLRRVLPAFLVLICATSANAQFTSSGTQTITGQLGAGTATPRATLDVVASPSDNYVLWVASRNGAAMLVVDKMGKVGVGTSSPSALLDIAGSGDNGDIGLQLRSGNSTSTYSSSQIIFAYGPSALYPQSIVTRATAGQYPGNEIDFFLWNSTAQPSVVGTQQVLGLVSTTSVHIQPVGTPVYELVVSSGTGLTPGGGSVTAAVYGSHSSRTLKTVVAALNDHDQDLAYDEVKSLKPARFRYIQRNGGAGGVVPGLIYEDSPTSIKDERGQSIALDARVANMEMALATANRRIKDLERKIADAERGGGR